MSEQATATECQEHLPNLVYSLYWLYRHHYLFKIAPHHSFLFSTSVSKNIPLLQELQCFQHPYPLLLVSLGHVSPVDVLLHKSQGWGKQRYMLKSSRICIKVSAAAEHTCISTCRHASGCKGHILPWKASHSKYTHLEDGEHGNFLFPFSLRRSIRNRTTSQQRCFSYLRPLQVSCQKQTNV